MRLALLFVALVSLFACSSETTPAPSSSSSGDASTTSSTSSSSGSTAACVGPGSGSSGGVDACNVHGDWTCGSDSWIVECSCPTATCQCKKNGSLVKSVSFAGCSTSNGAARCDTSLVPGGECGVPL